MMDYPHEGQWVRVPPEVARQYGCYGIGGWLAVFLVLLAVWVIGSVVWLVDSLVSALPGFGRAPSDLQAAVMVTWLLTALQISWGIVALLLAFRLRPSFPRVVIAGLAVFGVLGSFLMLWVVRVTVRSAGFSYQNQVVMPIVLVTAGLFLLIIWYFIRSKRVNATYRSRLSSTHPSAAPLLGRPAAKQRDILPNFQR